MRPKATSMIRFAQVFTVINVLISAYYYIHMRTHMDNQDVADWDRGHAVMLMAGAMLWVVCILVWSRTARDEKTDE